MLLAVAGGDGGLYHAGAHEVRYQEVATIGRQENRAGEAHGAGDAHIAEYAHQLDDHLERHKGVRQAHCQREQEEHRLLRHHRMPDLAVVTADLCQHTIAAAAVGHIGELLDRQYRRARNDQYKANVDGQIANHSVHLRCLRVHLGTRDEDSPRPRLLAVNEQIVEQGV